MLHEDILKPDLGAVLGFRNYMFGVNSGTDGYLSCSF